MEHNRLYHDHFIPSVMAQITIDPLRQYNDGGDTVDMMTRYRSDHGLFFLENDQIETEYQLILQNDAMKDAVCCLFLQCF